MPFFIQYLYPRVTPLCYAADNRRRKDAEGWKEGCVSAVIINMRNKHPESRGSGFPAVTAASTRLKDLVIGDRTKYCKGAVGDIHTLKQMAERVFFFLKKSFQCLFRMCGELQRKAQMMMMSVHMQSDKQASSHERACEYTESAQTRVI